MRTQKTSYPLEWFCAKKRLIFKWISQLKTFPSRTKQKGSLFMFLGAVDATAEPVPKLPSTAQKLSHLAAFSTSHQTTHPDADTQTTCARNAAQRGNQYQYFNLITCTDGPFNATHLFYLFNSFDYFLLMAGIYPFLLFWNFRTVVGAACGGRHDHEGKMSKQLWLYSHLSPHSSWSPILCRLPRGPGLVLSGLQDPSHLGGRLFLLSFNSYWAQL